MERRKILKANLVDVCRKDIYPVEMTLLNKRIESIRQIDEKVKNFFLPGWIDAHIHIESSMLVPTEFAKIAVRHGTVATVSDPHEIANVLGVEGVEYMIRNADKCPFKFNFGVPSCVPATIFETAGATIGPDDAKYLFDAYPQIKYLSEVMNYPGVINGDPGMLKLIAIAKERGKQVDGHAPGLRGEALQKYINAGITTDHECFTYEEGLEKLQLGMKIIIREGSAAKNFDALIPLLKEFPDKIMFCSDDKHPDDLLEGHINLLVSRAVAEGYDLYDVVKAASVNSVLHYNLEVGTLKEGDPADFQIVEDLVRFKPLEVYIDGEEVLHGSHSIMPSVRIPVVNNFQRRPLQAEEIVTPEGSRFRTIKVLGGQLITGEGVYDSSANDEKAAVLKLVNVNRYSSTPPALAFVENFHLADCAIAGSVAHDSHNIIATGASDDLIIKAVNEIISCKGGITFVAKDKTTVLPLPVAGIMSDRNCEWVGHKYQELDRLAKQYGCTLSAPFMTLSFLALLVIPQLKLSDLGLFDSEKFEFKSLIIS